MGIIHPQGTTVCEKCRHVLEEIGGGELETLWCRGCGSALSEKFDGFHGGDTGLRRAVISANESCRPLTCQVMVPIELWREICTAAGIEVKQ